MAVQSKDYVYSRLIAAFAGSNPAEGMDVGLFYLLCFMYEADLHSFRGVLPGVCVCACVLNCT